MAPTPWRDRQGIYFCFCGPTASGKSSICRELAAADPALQLSISTTTRKARPGEVADRDYFFVNEEEFSRRVHNGDFIEHALFSKHYYGTEKKNLETVQAGKKDLLLDIDLQGVREFKKQFAAQTVTIFVVPPSFSELKKRLIKRAGDDQAQIESRLEVAVNEMELLSQPAFSDYLVVNDRLERAVLDARAIIQAEQLALSRLNTLYVQTITRTPT